MPAIAKRFLEIGVVFVFHGAHQQQRPLQVVDGIGERDRAREDGARLFGGQTCLRRGDDKTQAGGPRRRAGDDATVFAPAAHGQPSEQARGRVVGVAFELGAHGEHVIVGQRTRDGVVEPEAGDARGGAAAEPCANRNVATHLDAKARARQRPLDLWRA